MFFSKIHLFLIKKNIKNRLTNVSHNGSASSVKKVGVILDEKYIDFKEVDTLKISKTIRISKEN